MNSAPTRRQFAKLLQVAQANGMLLAPIPAPHPDGFGGTRDAAILASYDREGGFVFVQAVARTRDLLKRAGVSRTRTHAFYKIPVVQTFAGLQINGTAANS